MAILAAMQNSLIAVPLGRGGVWGPHSQPSLTIAKSISAYGSLLVSMQGLRTAWRGT